MTVIDTVASPPVDAMRAAGVTGVIRYVSLVQQNTVWKRITKPEYDTLRGAGLDVLLNWEYAATDWLGGSGAGGQHAAQAVAQAQALGYPQGCAIVGSADFNMTSAQWATSGGSYARAFSQGIRAGGYVAGVYGPWDVLGWCQSQGGFGVFWQAGMSTAWSGGRNAQLWPGAHLRQRGHVTIAGQDCDYNDVLQPNYGQAGGTVATTLDSTYQRADGEETSYAQTLQDIMAIVFSGAPFPAAGTGETRTWLVKQLGALAAPTVTQDQVDAAVAKVMTDPAWIGQVAAALAGHIHVA